jgi:hypothetical protein
MKDIEIDKLYNRRRNFISTKAKIAKIISPNLFRLNMENFSNVRNSIIISVALPSLGLLVFNGLSIHFLTGFFLLVSTVGFLLTIIIFSFYLKINLDKGIKMYTEKMKSNISLADKAISIINNRLDEKITKKEVDNKLFEIDKEIEYEKIRGNNYNKKEDNYNPCILLGFIGNFFFIFSIIFLVMSFLVQIINIFN